MALSPQPLCVSSLGTAHPLGRVEGLLSARMAGRLEPALSAGLDQDASEKNNKRDSCKAPGSRCFPFVACGEKAQRGEGVGTEKAERKKTNQREQAREEAERQARRIRDQRERRSE